MRARCEEAQGQLQSTDEACKSLLDRAGSLRDEQYASPTPFSSVYPLELSQTGSQDPPIDC